MSLKKIAEIAGVSVSTVSRVINNKDTKCASKQVQNKIWAAVRQLEYSPNLYARSLKSNSSSVDSPKRGSIGYCYTSHFLIENGQNWELLSAIKQEIQKHNFTAVFYDLARLPSDISSTGTNGLIVIGSLSKKQYSLISKSWKNIVCVTDKSISAPVDAILLSQPAMLTYACRRMKRHGHEGFCFLGSLATKSDDLKVEYLRILDQFGATYYESCSAMFDALDASAKAPVPPAVIFEGSTTAQEYFGVLEQRGIIPIDDQSLICLDDDPYFTGSFPCEVPSLQFSNHDVSVCALSLLIDRIQKKHSSPVTIELECMPTI